MLVVRRKSSVFAAGVAVALVLAGCSAHSPERVPSPATSLKPAAGVAIALLAQSSHDLPASQAKALCLTGPGMKLAQDYASSPISSTHDFGTVAAALAEWQEHRYPGSNEPRSPWRSKPADLQLALCIYDAQFGNLKVPAKPGSPEPTFTRITIVVVPSGTAQLDTASTPDKLPVPRQG